MAVGFRAAKNSIELIGITQGTINATFGNGAPSICSWIIVAFAVASGCAKREADRANHPAVAPKQVQQPVPLEEATDRSTNTGPLSAAEFAKTKASLRANSPQIDWTDGDVQVRTTIASKFNPRSVATLLDFSSGATAPLNGELRNAKSTGEATNYYWHSIRFLEMWRRDFLKASETALRNGEFRDEMLEKAVKGTWVEGTVRENAESRRIAATAMLMIVMTERFLDEEATTVAALDGSKVDSHLVDWASAYVAWLRKDAVHKKLLFKSMSRETESANDVPTAFAEALIRYSLGDSNFSTAWDQQQVARRQASDAMRECETMGLELDKEAGQLTADCMKLRAALSKEYGVEFGALSVP